MSTIIVYKIKKRLVKSGKDKGFHVYYIAFHVSQFGQEAVAGIARAIVGPM